MSDSLALSPSGRPRPIDVGVYTKRRQLTIAWSDGRDSTYDWEFVRWNCPCAVCQGEMGSPGVLQSTSSLTPEQTTMVDLREVGHYALQPVWQDGHDTGIYSYDLLRRLGER